MSEKVDVVRVELLEKFTDNLGIACFIAKNMGDDETQSIGKVLEIVIKNLKHLILSSSLKVEVRDERSESGR